MRGDKEESFRSCLENCVEETRIELGKERNGAVKKKKKKRRRVIGKDSRAYKSIGSREISRSFCYRHVLSLIKPRIVNLR